tara:strand:+ start:404 stop:1222 length:819 start_codon:yes stop_codon:yes gene_type:complete
MVVPGYNMPTVADSNMSGFNIENPGVLEQINGFIQSRLNEKQWLHPVRGLSTTRAKLNLIGLDFPCTGKETVSDGTVAEYPVTQFGGRYGWDSTLGEVVQDDGIEHRLGYSLKLVAEFTKAANGLYEIDMKIVPDVPETVQVGESHTIDLGFLSEHVDMIPESEILLEDATAARELEMYIENDATIYKRRLLPSYKNLVTKMAREQYDSKKAAKLMMYTVNDAAKAYSKEYSQGESIFDKKTKEMVAMNLVKNFEAEAKLGNYNDLLPKKYQ